jgi:hypothetical protein
MVSVTPSSVLTSACNGPFNYRVYEMVGMGGLYRERLFECINGMDLQFIDDGGVDCIIIHLRLHVLLMQETLLVLKVDDDKYT